jgi:CheY-like chemotaxis protein
MHQAFSNTTGARKMTVIIPNLSKQSSRLGATIASRLVINMLRQPVHILLVEDDEIDAEQILRAFRHYQVDTPYTHVIDGVEALHVLRGEGGYTRLPRPYIILLDINMPRMNGLELLSALRRDPELKRSVVFVLTTSNRDEDIMAAYDGQIAGYLLKSKVSEDFLAFVKLLNLYQVMIEIPR